MLLVQGLQQRGQEKLQFKEHVVNFKTEIMARFALPYHCANKKGMHGDWRLKLPVRVYVFTVQGESTE